MVPRSVAKSNQLGHIRVDIEHLQTVRAHAMTVSCLPPCERKRLRILGGSSARLNRPQPQGQHVLQISVENNLAKSRSHHVHLSGLDLSTEGRHRLVDNILYRTGLAPLLGN